MSKKKKIGRIEYTVDSTPPYAIQAWDTENPNAGGEPFWHQPHDLTGAPWSSKTDAESFAVEWLNEHFGS